MEFEKKIEKPNPWTTAIFFSRLTFGWLIPLFLKGRKGNLQPSDIYDCPDVDMSEKIGEALQKEWGKELEKLKTGKQPSLIKATFRMFGLRYCLSALYAVVKECFCYVMQAVLLSYLIQHFARINVLSEPDLCMTATGLCLLIVMVVFLHHPYYFDVQRIGMRLRIACCTLIYRKCLKLSQATLIKTTVGQMVNLLSNDVNKFDPSAEFIPYLVIAPIQAIIITYVLWMYVGYASIAGVSVMVLYIPFQVYMGKLFSRFRMKTAALTDERIRLMNEIIKGMRVIKMYGWEIPFAKLVDFKRRKEMEKIRRTAFLLGLNTSVQYISLRLVFLVAFTVFLLGCGGDLTPDKMFVCMTLYTALGSSCTFQFFKGMSLGAQSIVSLKRIQKFLLLEEQSETSILDVSDLRPKLDQCGIWMKHVNASWNKNGEATLSNVSLTVRPGELLVVIGPVGCGKTSLLLSILGELPVTSGEVKVRGKVAYASQEPWVFGGSVQQNVIFGSEFDESKYKKVLDVCALNKDIEQFPYGDQTAVGERGVILSGGQKARVNLARAMYLDADVFILDDPLSAVDSSVSKHLFEKCINGYLKDKVRILATHQIQFLKEASQILVLKEGGCLTLGTYEELTESGIDLGFLMEDSEQKRRHRLASIVSNTSTNSKVDGISEGADLISVCESIFAVDTFADEKHVEGETNQLTNQNAPKVDEEIKCSGAVKMKVYKEYIKSGAGYFMGLLFVISYIFTQVFSNGSDFWLTEWTNNEQIVYNIKECWHGTNKTYLNHTGVYNVTYGVLDRDFFRRAVGNVSDACFYLTQNYLKDEFDTNQKVNSDYYLSVYALLVFVTTLLCLVRVTAYFRICTKASIALHNKMFQNVLRSPVAFFDRNPVGRVLNRFSKDAGIVDETIPWMAGDVFTMASNLIGIICIIIIVEPWLLIPTAILFSVFILLRRFYLPTARDIKRYEGTTRSPVFSHLSTSLQGLSTIRAFKVQRTFEISFDHYQDQHTATWFLFIGVTHWFSAVLDSLSTVFIIVVIATMTVLSKDPSYASRAGLAISSALQFISIFQYCVSQFTEVENQMTSVERIVEYGNLEPEAALESEKDQKPPKNWPSEGHITYQNVSLRYVVNEPPVLKNLNFEIYPKEKIGIVGRTGAGKSSMITVLLRMAEPDGVVTIDGINTKGIGLHDLRKGISIIPQDPVLFTGPVRKNLDPFSEHTDNDLWKALEEAYLKEAIEEMVGGLDTEVLEGGANFSVGQKQLMCLARAILRRNRILVLDEATANVDPTTDRLIQQTIRYRFANCTILTVAHRLHTIMDCDRVLVLGEGEVKEFDKPYTLLRIKNSLFSRMVQMTGPTMANQLREVARRANQKGVAEKESNIQVFGGNGDNDVINMNSSSAIARSVAVGFRPSAVEGFVNEAYDETEITHL